MSKTIAPYACFHCGSTTHLAVVVKVFADLNQDDPENLTTDATNADHEWDDYSTMLCKECGTHAIAEKFNQGESK